MRVSIGHNPWGGLELRLTAEFPAGKYLILENFMRSCRSPDVAHRVLDEYRHARQHGTPWFFNANDNVVRYSPSTDQVVAEHELSDLHDSIPPCSLAAADFEAILVDWLNALPHDEAQANRTAPS
jgi:hypothetical protein